MKNQMIHPKLMDNLYRFFPHTCDIQRGEYISDGVGETSDETKDWDDLYQGISCKVSAWNATREGNEMRRPDKTVVLHPYVIMLRGLYENLKEGDRVIHGQETHDILSIDFDSEKNMTRLACERITI